jgi:uncharacterized membrane protein
MPSRCLSRKYCCFSNFISSALGAAIHEIFSGKLFAFAGRELLLFPTRKPARVPIRSRIPPAQPAYGKKTPASREYQPIFKNLWLNPICGYNGWTFMQRTWWRTIPFASRALSAGIWGSLCAALIAAPLLACLGMHRSASLLYALFSPVCHQDPGRSLRLCGYPLAVCHRCTGIYFGLLIASWLPFERIGMLATPARRRAWALAATTPLVLDALLQFTGGYASTPATRLGTGFLFGAMLASLVVAALHEILQRSFWRRANMGSEA